MDQISITLPDDWHLHLRDDSALSTTVPAATRGFGRGIVKLKPITIEYYPIDHRDQIGSH